MSWIITMNERNKLAIAIAAAFAVIVLANFFVSYSIANINSQFKSVYEDRLIPSLDISEVVERYYQNRIYLEEYILAENSEVEHNLDNLMQANYAAIDSVIYRYEKTYLVERESEGLQNYKAQFDKLVVVQERILKLSREGNKEQAMELYRTAGYEAFNNLLVPLHSLIKLQGEVGKELYQAAERQVKALNVLYYLVLGISVFIALFVATFLQTSRKLRQVKPQKFHLN